MPAVQVPAYGFFPAACDTLGVIQDLCETITVPAPGQMIAESSYKEVSADAAVIAAYLGTPDR